MATRRISTRLAIEGDAEFRQALSQSSAELRKLDSALKLTESAFQGQANSMAALTAKSQALSNVYSEQEKKVALISSQLQQGQAAVKQYEQNNASLTSRIQENNSALVQMDESVQKSGAAWAKNADTIEKSEQQLAKLKSQTGDTSAEEAKLEASIERARSEMEKLEKSTDGAAKEAGELIRENNKLNGELSENEAKYKAAQRGVTDYETKLNQAETALNQTGAAIKENNQHLDEAATSADGCATSIDEFGNKTQKGAQNIDTLGAALVAAGVVKALKEIADAFKECAEASIEFESAMAGVKKTTDLSESELEAMGDSFKKMSTEIPQTASELAELAENAGQLGIEKQNIEDFSRVMADLGVATNLSGEEAAQTLAKFANITEMPQAEFENLGSTIVDLGNNLATTEADIAAMGMKLAAAGSQVGMTEGQILGIAGALSSLGLESQAGGSAFSKVMKQMAVDVETGGGNLENFASVAGMTVSQFSDLFRNDAASALSAFIVGLGDTESMGQSTITMLDEMGLTELRLSDALLRTSNASDLFTNAIQMGTAAWEENTALATEAETRYGTTESKLEMLENAFTNVKIAIGDALAPAIGMLADALTDLMDGFSDFIEDNEAIVPLLIGAAAAVGIFAAAIAAYTVATKIAKTVTEAFGAATKSIPIVALVSAIAGAAIAIATLIANYDDGVESTKELTEASREAVESLDDIAAAQKESEDSALASASAAENYANMLDKLASSGSMSNVEQKQYALIVDELNSLIPGLNATIDEQTGFIVGGTDALRDNIEAWKESAIEQGRAEALTEKYKALGVAQVELAENTNKAAEKEAELAEITERLTEIDEEYDSVLADAADSMDAMGNVSSDVQEKLNALGEEKKNLGEESRDLVYALEQLNPAVEVSQENYDLLADEIENTEGAMSSLSGATSDSERELSGLDKTQQKYADSISELSSELSALESAYEEAYATARETIEGSVGLFDTFESETTMSTQQMMEAWRTQAANVQAYQENLVLASQYLAPELAAAWSDGTAESAGYLQSFTSELQNLINAHGADSQEVQNFVNEFNAAYEGTGAAKDVWAENVAKMETDFDSSMSAIKNKLSETGSSMLTSSVSGEWRSIGSNITSGVASGISANGYLVSSAARQIIDEAMKAMRKQAVIKSPSKRFRDEVGRMVSKGFALGIRDGESEAKKAAKDLANSVYSSAMDAIEYRKYFNKLSLKEELATYKKMLRQFKKYSEQRRDLQKEIYRVEQEISAARYDAYKKKIDDREKYEDLSVQKQYAYWKKYLRNFKKGSEEYNSIRETMKDLREQNSEEVYEKRVKAIEDAAKYENLSLEKQLKRYQSLLKKYKKTSDEYAETREKIRDLKYELAEEKYANRLEYINIQTEYGNKSIQQQIKLYEQLAKKYKAGSDHRIEVENQIRQLRKDAYEQAIDLEKEYQDAVESRADKLFNSWGLLDFADESDYVDSREALYAMESQLDRLNEYSDKMAEIQRRGVTGDLLEELREFGAEDTSALDALLRMTDQQLNSYVEMYGEKQRLANEQATKELSALRDETDKEIAALLGTTAASLKKNSAKVGTEIVNGVAEGINSRLPYLLTQLEKMNEAIVKASKKQLDINSPSGVYRRDIGAEIPEGTALGVEDKTEVAVDAIKAQMQAMKAAAQSEMVAVSINPEVFAPTPTPTTAGGGNVITNHAEITLYVQRMTQAEEDRFVNRIDSLFGSAATINIKE